MGRLLVVMIILSLAVVVPVWDDLPGKPATEKRLGCIGLNKAWTMAKVIVRQHLGGPLVVGFPNRAMLDGLDGISFRHLGDCRYKISAFVDAYYRHSGLKRRFFVIELSYRGPNGWRMDQLDFAEHPNSQTSMASRDAQKSILKPPEQ